MDIRLPYSQRKGSSSNFPSNIKNEFKLVNQLLFRLKSSENLWFSDDFRGNRSNSLKFAGYCKPNLEMIPKREYTDQIFNPEFARVLRIVLLRVQEFS